MYNLSMTRVIAEFDIIKGLYHTGLVKEVKKALAEGGWELYGQPYADGKGNHFQTIVKYTTQ
jgi:hypothetical protein